MAVTKLIFNPGINKEFTDLMDKGGWSDGNLVRFRKGLPDVKSIKRREIRRSTTTN